LKRKKMQASNACCPDGWDDHAALGCCELLVDFEGALGQLQGSKDLTVRAGHAFLSLGTAKCPIQKYRAV
jgi:hypothetical protein